MGSATQLRRMIGEWEVLHRLGDAEREVYTARRADGTLGILVVVEVDDDAAERMRAAVVRCHGVEHEAISSVLDDFPNDGKYVTVFEHIDGTSLHRLMKYFEEKQESLGDRAVLHVGALLVEALSAAHQGRDETGKVNPIIHGQLGPHQLLLSWDGDVKLMGLGLAAAFGGAEDEPEWLRPFMAPEVRAGGPITARANVYTAGAILWSLFSREPLPADGSKPSPLRRGRPDLPASITFPIDRAMELANKRISAKALAVSLSRTLEEADREELRWAMEVCRLRVAVDEELLPQESFPPKRARSMRAVSSLPPDSDRPTQKIEQKELLDKARLLGPLPWESDGDTVETEPAGDPSEAPPKNPARRVPRPSARRSRRTRSGNNIDVGNTVRSAMPIPKMRPRAATKRGLNSFMPPPEDPANPGPEESLENLNKTQVLSSSPEETHHETGGSQAPASVPPRVVAAVVLGDTKVSSMPEPVSYHHPASQAPITGYPSPSHVPLSYAPGYGVQTHAPPGASPPVYPSTPPTRWIVAVAMTAVASFAAGLFIASISGVKVHIGDQADAAPVPIANTPPAPVASPAPVPAPEPTVAPEVVPSAVPEASAAPEVEEPDPEPEPDAEPVEDGNSLQVSASTLEKAKLDAKALPLGVGMFLVRTSEPDAWVYVSGRPYSKAGVPFQVVCGPHHVRLGDAKRTRWFEPGQSITLACRELTDVTIEPRPAPAPQRRMVWPPANYPKGQFLK